MNLPSTRECFEIIQKMEMMDHIIDHSVMVSNVALCLGRYLKPKVPELNLELVAAASLLHDITKTRSFETGELHSKTGGEFLARMGYPEIANIIRQHVILDRCCTTDPVSEPEIVNYADKRVLHDKVVSLDKRLEYIQVRYGTNPAYKAKIEKMWAETHVIEEKLFRQIEFAPQDLAGRVRLRIKRDSNRLQSTT